MLKIRSKIDVITNSSTEVFLLNVDGKLLDEVTRSIDSFVDGHRPPEVLKMGEGILQETLDHGSSIFDPRSTKSMEVFRRWEIAKHSDIPVFRWDLTIPSEKKTELEKRHKTRNELFGRWVRFAIHHKEEIEGVIDKSRWSSKPRGERGPIDDSDEGRHRCQCLINPWWYGDCLPRGTELYKQFYRENKELFDEIPLPDNMNARRFVGKIGVIGMYDNSIPYECFNKIMGKYPGSEQYHLG